MSSPDPLTAAEALEGATLHGGWTVAKKLEPSFGTGGNFSVQYEVENSDGRQAFCKALDLGRAFAADDPAFEIEHLVRAFNFEREILEKCRLSRLSRVVTAIGHGIAQADGFPRQKVNYILFELADFDIRKAVQVSSELGVVGKTRATHHVAVGLKQLHSIGIAHQDIKPSNILLFPGPVGRSRSAKIGDLGRAYDRSREGPFDDRLIPGDPDHAPPELLYKSARRVSASDRMAHDVYQLGSLATFLFVGQSMNALLDRGLHATHSWRVWGGTYGDALDFVRDSYGRAMRTVRDALPQGASEQLATIIGYLCEPDPSLRGHPANRHGNVSRLDLTRVIAELDLTCRRLETSLGGRRQ